MLVLARGGDHFFNAQFVGDCVHLRQRSHNVARGLSIQADDLQNDVFFCLRDGALLERQLDQFLVFLIRKTRLRPNGLRHQHLQNPFVEPLDQTLKPAGGKLNPQHERRDSEGPRLRGSHRQRFWKHFAANQHQEQNRHHRRRDGPIAFHGGP